MGPTAMREVQNGVFRIITNKRIDRDVLVYVFVMGTANPGYDYIPVPPSLLFPANTDTLRVPLIGINDLESEINETVILQIRRHLILK